MNCNKSSYDVTNTMSAWTLSSVCFESQLVVYLFSSFLTKGLRSTLSRFKPFWIYLHHVLCTNCRVSKARPTSFTILFYIMRRNSMVSYIFSVPTFRLFGINMRKILLTHKNKLWPPPHCCMNPTSPRISFSMYHHPEIPSLDSWSKKTILWSPFTLLAWI